MRKVLWELFHLVPSPVAAEHASTDAIQRIIYPLGLATKRAVMIKRFSAEYLDKQVGLVRTYSAAPAPHSLHMQECNSEPRASWVSSIWPGWWQISVPLHHCSCTGIPFLLLRERPDALARGPSFSKCIFVAAIT